MTVPKRPLSDLPGNAQGSPDGLVSVVVAIHNAAPDLVERPR